MYVSQGCVLDFDATLSIATLLIANTVVSGIDEPPSGYIPILLISPWISGDQDFRLSKEAGKFKPCPAWIACVHVAVITFSRA